MDIKLIFALISLGIVLAGYVPYIRDMFARRTMPHAYTWLIWSVTTGISTVGVWYGGGGYPAISMAVGTLCTVLVFVLSIKYGTRNITKGDTAALLAALVAVFVWVQLDNPLLSVAIAVTIDGIGYWPSFRKSFSEPWSESLSTWVLFNCSIVFSFLALSAYNPLTLLFYAVSFVCNLTLIVLCLYRRKIIPKPSAIKL